MITDPLRAIALVAEQVRETNEELHALHAKPTWTPEEWARVERFEQTGEWL
jgi:acid stress-induced BolA-like protein IbaG/YrbA